MSKVLSIDLDWILGDCISLYNDLVRGNVPILQLWEDIERERHCDKFLSYNKIYLEQLKKLVVKLKPKQVYWGNDHSSIILAIKDALDKKIISAPFILYNIDHHHDINYSPQQEEIIDKYDMANCGSWISYLNKYELIDEYFWIKNKYSTDYHGQKQFSPKRQEIELKNQDTLNFYLMKILILFILPLLIVTFPLSFMVYWKILKRWFYTIIQIELIIKIKLLMVQWFILQIILVIIKE